MQVKHLAVVHELQAPARAFTVEQEGQAHVGERLMVSVDLAIRGQVHEAIRSAPLSRDLQPVREVAGIAQEMLERRGHRERRVIEEAIDPCPSRRVGEAAVRPTGVDRRATRFPLSLPQPPHAPGLVRSQNQEAHPRLGDHAQGLGVDGGLGQPQAFGRAAKAVLKISQAPPHLRPLVGQAGQREDGVVIGLRHAAAVPAMASHGLPVGVEDALVDPGKPSLQVG